MRRIPVAGLLLAVVVLAGCVSKPEQGGLPPPLPSPSSSASRSTPAPKPTGTDVEQIVALTKDYYAEFTRAANTGDTNRLRSLVTPDCYCLAAVRNIEKVWSSGSIRAPNYYILREVRLPRVTSATTGVSNAVYTVNESFYLDKSGRVTSTFPADGRTQVDTLNLVKISGVWKVAKLEINT